MTRLEAQGIKGNGLIRTHNCDSLSSHMIQILVERGGRNNKFLPQNLLVWFSISFYFFVP